MAKKIELAPFTTQDWYAWAGAERFEDGSEPVICEVVRDAGLSAVVIADANGVSVNLINSDGLVRDFSLQLSGRISKHVAESLDEAMVFDRDALEKLGFENIVDEWDIEG